MGKPLSRGASARAPSRWSSPTSARRRTRAPRIASPNVGPAHGLPAARVLRPRDAQACRRPRSRRSRAQILDARISRASRSCSTRAVSSRASSPTATSRPLVVEIRGDKLEELDAQAKAVAEVARTRSRRARRPLVAADRVPRNPRRDAIARRPAWSASRARAAARRRSKRRSATSTRRASGSTRTMASRTTSSLYDADAGPRHPARSAHAPRARQRPRASRVTLGAYGEVRRSVGPIAVERNQLAARRARPHADRGARHRHRRGDLEARSQRDPRTRAVGFSFVGQVRADANDVLGPRPRARSRGDGRVHDHGVAVQVAAAAVRHALHDPGARSSGS